jgi:peptidoglycan/LPS O-acetylase OafA/YrhL
LLNWIAPILGGGHHWILGSLALTNSLAALALAVPAAAASYYLVELPFLRRKERRQRGRVRAALSRPVAFGETPPR